VKKLKILVIEDNRLLRLGTTALLNEQGDIIAVSTQGNIVLLDLGLKSQNSVSVIEAIKKQLPRTEVVVMDLLPSHSEVVEFFKAGVSGFVPRDATLEDFLHTIRSVAKGVRILPPTISESLFSQIVKSAIEGGKVDRVVEAVKLTKPEQDVASLMAKGKSIKETSLGLELATFVVKNHVRNVLDKLALHTRLELAAFAKVK
jgi:DNA-binding NarL/FixJ family response regulator